MDHQLCWRGQVSGGNSITLCFAGTGQQASDSAEAVIEQGTPASRTVQEGVTVGSVTAGPTYVIKESKSGSGHAGAIRRGCNKWLKQKKIGNNTHFASVDEWWGGLRSVPLPEGSTESLQAGYEDTRDSREAWDRRACEGTRIFESKAVVPRQEPEHVNGISPGLRHWRIIERLATSLDWIEHPGGPILPMPAQETRRLEHERSMNVKRNAQARQREVESSSLSNQSPTQSPTEASQHSSDHSEPSVSPAPSGPARKRQANSRNKFVITSSDGNTDPAAVPSQLRSLTGIELRTRAGARVSANPPLSVGSSAAIDSSATASSNPASSVTGPVDREQQN
jgi:hypothetical protein